MTLQFDIPLLESFDDFDQDDIRDLVRTTPLRFDDAGIPVGYEAEQLFALEGSTLGRFS